MAQVSTVTCNTNALHATWTRDDENRDGPTMQTLVGKTPEYYDYLGHCFVSYRAHWSTLGTPSDSVLIIF